MELRTSPLRGPARALRAVWTARGHRSRVAHRLPTLSRLSPTASTGPTTISIQTPSHLTSPTPTHHHLPLIHNAFELAPPPPDAPHRSGSSLDWKTLSSRRSSAHRRSRRVRRWEGFHGRAAAPAAAVTMTRRGLDMAHKSTYPEAASIDPPSSDWSILRFGNEEYQRWQGSATSRRRSPARKTAVSRLRGAWVLTCNR